MLPCPWVQFGHISAEYCDQLSDTFKTLTTPPDPKTGKKGPKEAFKLDTKKLLEAARGPYATIVLEAWVMSNDKHLGNRQTD